MGDKNLSNLLKWGIENSTPSTGAAVTGGATGPASAERATPRPIDPEVMAALFGGPSEADLMKAAMGVIRDPDPAVTVENKLIAFDNLEQLIENIDNANLLDKLTLWTPLLDTLAHEKRELRRYAAWVVGTAVQNNQVCQERLLAMGGIARLVGLATKDDEHEDVRRKAVYALSSAVRNYQPALDVAVGELAKQGHHGGDRVDADDMEAIDSIMEDLKEKAKPRLETAA